MGSFQHLKNWTWAVSCISLVSSAVFMSSADYKLPLQMFVFSEPNFIAAYDIGLFTYFFFRENAVEHDCGKTVYSRVARVCKNDIGGRFLLEDTWTTFMKARLNCSRAGEIPFYYNELQSTFYLPEQDLIYGVFTTNVWVALVLLSLFYSQQSETTYPDFLNNLSNHFLMILWLMWRNRLVCVIHCGNIAFRTMFLIHGS